MQTLTVISGLSCLVPITIALRTYRHQRSEMKYLLVLLVLALKIETLGFYFMLNNIKYFWPFHLYTLVEYGILMAAFAKWQTDVKFRRALRTSIPVFIVVWILAKLFFESFNEWDSFTSSLESLLLVGAASLTLFNLSKETFTPFYRLPQFWVASAVLIYFTGSILLFSMGNLLSEALVRQIMTTLPIHSIVNILANFCYAGAFLCHRQRPRFGGLLVSGL